MRPALSLQLGQHLALTPQLRQAIRLLALSTLELKGELTEAVETNPLLELDEGFGEAPSAEERAAAERETPDRDERADNAESASSEAPEERLEPVEDSWNMDDAWAEGRGSGSAPEDGDSAEARMPAEEDLADHLLWQLNLTPMSPRDRAIAVALIEALDADGYLRADLTAIMDAVADVHTVDEDEIEAVRHRLQRFDPVGVASRDLADCLDVQLADAPDSDAVRLARRLVREQLEALARADIERLARALDATEEAISEALALVRSLDPKPGSAFARETAEYVVPDAYVARRNGQWEVRLNNDVMPRLKINRAYADLVRQCSREDASYLRGRLQEARWLIRSLEQRDDTVLKVAQAIVVRQLDFLERGPEGMRPMVMREIAEDVGVHESTVSRVTTRKYLHTPRGTFEFKHFFSSHVATRDGGEASSTAIQAKIKRLIDEEQPAKPLSDSKLATLLKAQGILVARRTVAKYRELLRIPPSHERVRRG
ncbi:MAG: RNA polymerase factor sigma-54 [Lysobacterales bacterium]